MVEHDEEDLERIRQLATQPMDSPELMERARRKARGEREAQAHDDELAAIRTRFMQRGPAPYRVTDDEWWNR